MTTARLLFLPKPKATEGITAEAYFGSDNTFVSQVKLYVHELREIYVKSPSMAKKTFVAEVEKLAKILGDCIAKNVNAEKCSLTIIGDANAFCFPLCWDTWNKKDREKNIDKILSLEDIVETTKGYRFKKPEGKHLMYAIGLGLFDKMDDDEVTAIIFHEIGHSFQQMLTGINGNLVWSNLTNTLRENTMMLNIMMVLMSFGLALFIRSDTSKMKDIIEKDIAEVTPEINEAESNQFNREKASRELKSFSGKALRQIYGEQVDKANQNAFTKFFLFIFSIIFDTFLGVINLIVSLLYPLGKLIDLFSGIYFSANAGWFKKNRMFEEFADSFATSYALGAKLSSGLAKLHVNDGVDLGTLSFINYIPGINLYLAWSDYMMTSTACLMQGYPTAPGRFKVQYETLKHELDTNPEINAQERLEITAQMDEIAHVYDNFIQRPGSKNFVFRVIAQVTKKKIQDEKTDVNELVLDVLDQRKADIKDLRKVDKDLDAKLKILESDPKSAIKYLGSAQRASSSVT